MYFVSPKLRSPPLWADLKMSSTQVEKWFGNRRRAQDKLEALRAEEARRAAITWPLYKLNSAKQSQVLDEGKLASMKVEEARGGQGLTNPSAHSGKGLLEELEGNVKEVERRALDMLAIRPIPLLAVTPSQQEVIYFALIGLCVVNFVFFPPGGVLCAESASERLGPGLKSSFPVSAYGSGKECI